jgi:predicted PurR-regulated permease PerM
VIAGSVSETPSPLPASPGPTVDPDVVAPPTSSPKWGSTIKLIVGLTLAGIFVVLLIYFRNLISPVMLAFILSYLLHPVVNGLRNLTGFTWRSAVNLVYVILVILLVYGILELGKAAATPIDAFYKVIIKDINNLPALVATLSTQVFVLGPFELDMSTLDLQTITEQILTYVQTLLGRAGNLVSALAASAAAALGWGLFVLVVSYFLLSEAEQVPTELLSVDMPNYQKDLLRLSQELKKVWNAFLRGQIIVVSMVIISYSVLMTVLGVRYALLIALLAGLSRFVPYLGPLTAWTVLGLITFFQPANYFGLTPLQYTLLVIVAAVILDQIYDNLISPRVFGQTLGIHPAAVLIAAIVAANLIGLLGLILAAPTVATLKLLGRYVLRKMLDLEPWPVEEARVKVFSPPLHTRLLQRSRAWYILAREWQKSLRLPHKPQK